MINATWVDTVRLQLRGAPRGTALRGDIRHYNLKQAVLRVRDSGPASAEKNWPTVVLVCDPPNVLEHFDGLFRLCEGHGRLICVEPPGFAFSRPKLNFKFGFEEYYTCFSELLRVLSAGPYVLAFTCVWGHIALQLAARQPDAVSKLLLWQTPSWEQQVAWSKYVDTSRTLARPFLGQAANALALSRIASDWYKVALNGNAHKTFYPILERGLKQGAFCCLASLWQQWFKGFTPQPLSLTKPALMTWGEADLTHRLTDKLSLVNELPQIVRHEFFADAGHSPELEAPERFFGIIKRWVQGPHSLSALS